jgi:predicted lipid-binding transport protein (Tim44 family)
VLSQLRQRLAATQRRRATGPPPPSPPPSPVENAAHPPPPWDVEAFLDVARRSFIGVQHAWDRADLAALSALSTEHLFQELCAQLAERGSAPNHTEVLHIEARLLAIEDLCEAQLACVEFSGLIRERHDAPPTPFRELWMLTCLRPVGAALPGEATWRVARVQALG